MFPHSRNSTKRFPNRTHNNNNNNKCTMDWDNMSEEELNRRVEFLTHQNNNNKNNTTNRTWHHLLKEDLTSYTSTGYSKVDYLFSQNHPLKQHKTPISGLPANKIIEVAESAQCPSPLLPSIVKSFISQLYYLSQNNNILEWKVYIGLTSFSHSKTKQHEILHNSEWSVLRQEKLWPTDNKNNNNQFLENIQFCFLPEPNDLLTMIETISQEKEKTENNNKTSKILVVLDNLSDLFMSPYFHSSQTVFFNNNTNNNNNIDLKNFSLNFYCAELHRQLRNLIYQYSNHNNHHHESTITSDIKIVCRNFFPSSQQYQNNHHYHHVSLLPYGSLGWLAAVDVRLLVEEADPCWGGILPKKVKSEETNPKSGNERWKVTLAKGSKVVKSCFI